MMVSVSFASEPVSGGTAQQGTQGTSTYTLAETGKFAVMPVPLKDEFGNPLPGMTGLKWMWFDALPTSWQFSIPVCKAAGAGESTDVNGKLSIDVGLYTSLDIGDVGFLVVTSSNNDPDQTPAARSWAYPVQLSGTP
jgi:hypothetical protein